jgi:glycosyltransferase involved in cell wall biosynthesis
MRVLVFSTDDHVYPAGGAEQAFGNISERLPHIQFDLICAKLRRGAKGFEQIGNVRIYRMGFGIPKVDGFILALFGHFCAYKLMKKHTYDLMWSVMATYGAFSAVRVKKKTGIPFLLTLQEGDAFEHIYSRVKWVRTQFNEIFSIADGVQAISQHLLQWSKDMGYRGRVLRVVPNGVAIDAFTREVHAKEKARARESFGFPQDAFILFTSSRLEKKNAVGDVVEALQYMPSQVCFVVCGSGSLEQDIRAKIQKLGLEKRVLLKGFVDPSELPLLMKASDAFIRPSHTEGLGNAFLEAMAARIPVIGTLAGGIKDFLTDGETGFVVGVEDPKSIANTVARIRALDMDAKERILDTAEYMVRERYNWERVSREMEDVFNETIACTQ